MKIHKKKTEEAVVGYSTSTASKPSLIEPGFKCSQCRETIEPTLVAINIHKSSCEGKKK